MLVHRPDLRIGVSTRLYDGAMPVGLAGLHAVLNEKQTEANLNGTAAGISIWSMTVFLSIMNAFLWLGFQTTNCTPPESWTVPPVGMSAALSNAAPEPIPTVKKLTAAVFASTPCVTTK